MALYTIKTLLLKLKEAVETDESIPADDTVNPTDTATTNEPEAEITWEGGRNTFPTTQLFDKFGSEPFVIVDTGDYNRQAIPSLQEKLDEVCDNGYVDEHGQKYEPAFAGASQARNGMFTMVQTDMLPTILEWAACGLDLTKLSVSKRAKYLALMMSACRKWADVFPEDGPLGMVPQPAIRDFCVLKDVVVNVNGEFDKVGIKELVREPGVSENKISDGLAIYVVNDEILTNKARNELVKTLDAWTFRAPLMKGLMVPVLHSTLTTVLKQNGWNHIVKDFWGNEVDLLKKKVITFGSVFKAAKCVESFDVYCDNFERLGHEVWVCVQAHNRLNGMPYQQLQTLPLTDEEIEQLADEQVAQLAGYVKPGEFGKLIGKELGELADYYPQILNLPYVKFKMQQSYANRRRKLAGGRVEKVARNLFCSPDIYAILQGIVGEKVTGLIPAHKAVCASYEEGVKVDATRSPHLDHAHAIRRIIRPAEWLRGLYMGHTIFYSSQDNTMLLHQMDFDGDHSNVNDKKTFVEAAKRGYRVYNNRVLQYAAMDSGEVANSENYLQEFSARCKAAFKAPIGLYANSITKMWARAYDWAECAFLTRKCNTCIDEAGGHGADNATGKAEDYVNKEKFTPKPMHLAYAKGKVADDGVHIVLAEGKHKVYRTSVVDRYSQIILMELPETVDELYDFTSLGEFDFQMLRNEPNAKFVTIPGLCHDAKNGEYGVFNAVARATSVELAEIMSSSSLKALPDFITMKKDTIRDTVRQYAESLGFTFEQALDAIIVHLFYKMRRTNFGMDTLLRSFFIAFTDDIIENVKKNLGLESTSISAEDYDDFEYTEDDIPEDLFLD